MGTFEFLNSCGDTQDIKIIRNGENCDNTGVPMQCGRINAHTTVSDDWQYEHVGENIGQSKWIALTSRLGGASEWAEFALADENVEFALADENVESALAALLLNMLNLLLLLNMVNLLLPVAKKKVVVVMIVVVVKITVMT